MNPIRVLVVDDEEINLQVIQEYFADLNAFALYLVNSGEAAWEFLQNGPAVDIVLLDRMMPGLDGIGLLKLIKEDSDLRHTPVIMQTAADQPEQIREGMEAGAYYYLIKPYSGATLLAIVQAASSLIDSRHALNQRLDDCARALHSLDEARFFIRTVEEASQLASLVSHTFPDPGSACIGISELLVNAVEHGNLGIDYALKTQLKLTDQWKDEIDRRMAFPENQDKRVELHYKRSDHGISLKIYDEGQGFPWENFLELSAERACDPNGRGIALAKMLSFTRVRYERNGSLAIAEFDFVN